MNLAPVVSVVKHKLHSLLIIKECETLFFDAESHENISDRLTHEHKTPETYHHCVITLKSFFM